MSNTIIHLLSALTRLSSCLMATIALLCLGGCDKTPINGPLDGMWQLMTIETPGSTRMTEQQLVFVSFQLHLTQWDQKDTRNVFFAHFSHEGDSIRFYDFAKAALHDLSEGDDDHILTPTQMHNGAMDLWGIHSVDARYNVLKLNHKDLILQDADTTLTFRKF